MKRWVLVVMLGLVLVGCSKDCPTAPKQAPPDTVVVDDEDDD